MSYVDKKNGSHKFYKMTRCLCAIKATWSAFISRSSVFFLLAAGWKVWKQRLKMCERKWQKSSFSSHSAGLERWAPLGCPVTVFVHGLHHEPEQAWKGVLQYRCGRFNFYGFKALPEPQTYRIGSTGNCLVSQRKKNKQKIQISLEISL